MYNKSLFLIMAFFSVFIDARDFIFLHRAHLIAFYYVFV